MTGAVLVEMKSNISYVDYSFCQWYPLFSKNVLEAVMLPLPQDVCKYLEHDAFLLPLEAINKGNSCNSEWSDGSAIKDEEEEDSEEQPTFPEFSKQVQQVIEKFGSVFLKLNWSTPADATWVAATKSLKCNALEDVYLLLKSSDRISQDLSMLRSINDKHCQIYPCLVLKKWRDIDPCTEFRCFVVNKELVGISQRDVSQYYKHIENDKYNIQKDIKSMFTESIQSKFGPDDYSFDVIRYKKDKVKIVDFGPLNEAVTKNSLFTYEELHSEFVRQKEGEFRFISEDMGIQPKMTNHVCVPTEINEFFQGGISIMDAIRKEVEEQRKEENCNCN
ncbi:cell division cycle protein 123 homolog [Phymastichus coffea]|uniref:cell division cycle protein 123 homolog n=1 Tax=Phymastichus coffea TaxID=108790 RepID=UPI00273C2A27|nr:cell division cycle protein 123 homolog [Phymastichus coffea]